MASQPIPVYLETGKKRTFACSIEWPGWCRSGKTEEAALEALAEVAPRYAEVARAAGEPFPEVALDRLRVVERIEGNGTTDFGAPGKVAQVDWEPLDPAAAERLKTLLQASWDFLDRVVAGAPVHLKKGPRGGGRDRDDVFRHVLAAETAYARKTGLKLKEPEVGNREAIDELRRAILGTIRPSGDGAPLPVKSWPIPYAVRRYAWHVLDHAWEIQDKS